MVTRKKLSPKDFRQHLIENASPAEKDLGVFLKRHFQTGSLHWWHNSIVGPYFIDWYCKKAKIGIEMDGSSHFVSSDKINKDAARDKYLRKNHGIHIIRVTPFILYKDKSKLYNVVLKKIYKYLNSEIAELNKTTKGKQKLKNQKKGKQKQLRIASARYTRHINGDNKSKRNWY